METVVVAGFSIWLDKDIVIASLMPNGEGQLEVIEIYRESLAKRGKRNGELYALVDPRDWKVAGIISARVGDEDLRLMPLDELAGPHYLLCPVYRVTRLH